MQLNMKIVIVVLVVSFFLIAPSFISAQDDELFLLLDKITERINSYPPYNNLKFVGVKKTIHADKQWRSAGDFSTTTKSVIKIIDSKENYEILEVLETKNGKTRDVTQESIKELEQLVENIDNMDMDKEIDNKDIPEGAKKIVSSELEQVRKDMNDAMENGEQETGYEYLPFTKNNRAKYKFKKLGESIDDGVPVYIIEAKVIKKDKHLYEGKYYIDKETFDVIRFQGKPSKDPIPFFDVIDEEEQYMVLPEGIFVLKSSRIRMSADILWKNFGRLIHETEYSDYDILSRDDTK